MGAPEHEDRDKKCASGPTYGAGAETAMEGARPGPQRGGARPTARCHSIGHKMRIARIKIRVDSPVRWERA